MAVKTVMEVELPEPLVQRRCSQIAASLPEETVSQKKPTLDV